MTTIGSDRMWRIPIFVGSIIGCFPTFVLAAQVLYAIDGPYLSIVDKVTGAELLYVVIDVPGESITSGNGLAVNPLTNEMYAAVKLASQSGAGRNLIKIDPATGGATDIGNMMEPVASLAFADTGVLYAVTGDCSRGCGGEATPETLFTVNTADASLTFVQTLGNGNDGEAIAFDPNGIMYHMSGKGTGMVFEKINLTTRAITDIPLSGDLFETEEATGFTFDPTRNVFVGGVIDWALRQGTYVSVTPDGVVTALSSLPFLWRDYAFYDTAFVPSRFRDVPPDHWAYAFIEALATSRVTVGCGSTKFCPEDSVTRAQMAVFLERAMRGSDFAPPPATGNVFIDVAATDFAASFIEQLYLDGLTRGCTSNNYCPNDSVTRAQMAVLLLRAEHGLGYTPPPAVGIFRDVDLSHWAVAWIEQLWREKITSGCFGGGGGDYCPDDSVTRAQMAVFLVKAFGL